MEFRLVRPNDKALGCGSEIVLKLTEVQRTDLKLFVDHDARILAPETVVYLYALNKCVWHSSKGRINQIVTLYEETKHNACAGY